MRRATYAEQERIMSAKTRLLDGLKVELANGEISKPEALALFAHVTGMIVAMQDQRDMTPAQAMDVVVRNIEAGNASAIEQMLGDLSGSA